MILTIPFLATDIEQFDPSSVARGFGVEASIFDRRDILDERRWETVKNNVRLISSRYHPSSFTFHFPVNDCNYLEDESVKCRLYESLEMVDRHQLNGLVLHSNQVYTVKEWMRLDVVRIRERFSEFIQGLRGRVKGAGFWIGLENMPIMGNQGLDLDPLLVFPDDFQGLVGDNVGVTWDFCHYSYSVHVSNLLRSGELPEQQYYPVVGTGDFDDFKSLAPHLLHFHFSAFDGVASVLSGAVCKEGQVPWESTLQLDTYVNAFKLMILLAPDNAVTLEIAERDYRHRINVYRVVEWCSALANAGKGDNHQ